MSLMRDVKQRIAVFLKDRSGACLIPNKSALSPPLSSDEDEDGKQSQNFMDTDIAITWLYEACNKAHGTKPSQWP